MGIGCVWSARCRGRSRNAAARVENDHEAGGNDLSRQDYPQLRGDSPLVEALRNACRIQREKHRTVEPSAISPGWSATRNLLSVVVTSPLHLSSPAGSLTVHMPVHVDFK